MLWRIGRVRFLLDLKARKEVQRREGSVHFCGDGRECAGSRKIVGKRMKRRNDIQEDIAGIFDRNITDTRLIYSPMNIE